ncbi:hypothetical protein ACN47E_000599 [Coniothyrium glycines]
MPETISKDIPTFQHSPLEFDHEIRLLRIEPPSTNGSPIRVLIEHVNFEHCYQSFISPPGATDLSNESPVEETVAPGMSQDAASAPDSPITVGTSTNVSSGDPQPGQSRTCPTYTALSYTWGDENPTFDIVISYAGREGRFPIRRNLYQYLCMRVEESEASDSQQSHWLWIDQLCIDQSNMTEKSWQVALMAAIFSSASSVDVWIGPAFPGSDDMMDFLNGLRFSKNNFNDKEREQIHRKMHEIWKFDFQRHHGAVTAFLEAPYWSRLWIIQEITLAKKAIVRLGHKKFNDARRLGRAIEEMESRGVLGGDRANTGRRATGAQCHRISRCNGNMDWHSLKTIAQATNCTETRDRAFGLLGLVPEPLRWSPDYTMHPQDILLCIMRKQLAYDILTERHRDGKFHDFVFISRARDNEYITLAEWWFHLLGGRAQNIDLKVVRKCLIREIYSNTMVPDARMMISLKGRLYLWWWFPSKNSFRCRLADETDPLAHHGRRDAKWWREKRIMWWQSRERMGYLPEVYATKVRIRTQRVRNTVGRFLELLG